MGIWSSLTFQGKVLAVGVIVGGLFLLSMVFGAEEKSPALTSPGPVVFAGSPVSGLLQQRPAAAVSPSPASQAVVSPSAAASQTVTLASTQPAAATSEIPAASPTLRPPTTVPTQPPAPTPVPPGCTVSATVQPSQPPGNEAVTGTLMCAGSGTPGAAMNAVLIYQQVSSGCSGSSDASGRASCVSRVGDVSTGQLISVEVCFNQQGTKYCAAASVP